jgi:hypothetical protein
MEPPITVFENTRAFTGAPQKVLVFYAITIGAMHKSTALVGVGAGWLMSKMAGDKIAYPTAMAGAVA